MTEFIINLDYIEYIKKKISQKKNNRFPTNFFKKKDNRIKMFHYIAYNKNFKLYEDFYTIKSKAIPVSMQKCGGKIFLLKECFPKYKWLNWEFKNTNTVWKKKNKFIKENIIELGKYMEQKFNYTKPEDWYNIMNDDIEYSTKNNEGYRSIIYHRIRITILEFLKLLYPDYKWLPWKFEFLDREKPNSETSKWDDSDNRINLREQLTKELGYSKPEDWYNISLKSMSANVKNYWKTSPYKLVKDLFPNEEWPLYAWLYKTTPSGYWKSKKHRKFFMNWLGNKLGYKKPEDWYKIKIRADFMKYAGGLLNHNFVKDNSFLNILKEVYPDYKWLPWKFSICLVGWDDKKNHKWFCEELGKELGYTCMEDWYKCTQKNITDSGGAGLLQLHYNHYTYLIMESFPDYKWLPWRFNLTPIGFWRDKKNHKWFCEELGKELGYTCMEDWYGISFDDFCVNYYTAGRTLVDTEYYPKNKNIKNILIECFPDYKWDMSKFYRWKGEGKLYKILCELYGKDNVIEQYKVDWCKNPHTKRHLPYDFYIISLKIIVSLDGEQHVKFTPWFHRDDIKNFEKQQDIDIFKINCALKNNTSMVRILGPDFTNNKVGKNEIKNIIETLQKEEEPNIKLLGDWGDKIFWEFE